MLPLGANDSRLIPTDLALTAYERGPSPAVDNRW